VTATSASQRLTRILDEFGQSIQSGFKILAAGGKREPDVALGAKRGAWNHIHMADLKGRLAELCRVGNQLARGPLAKQGRHIEGHIEGTTGLAEPAGTQSPQAIANDSATRIDPPPHSLHAFLRTFESRQGCILADARWATGLLALHVGHRPNDRRRA